MTSGGAPQKSTWMLPHFHRQAAAPPVDLIGAYFAPDPLLTDINQLLPTEHSILTLI